MLGGKQEVRVGKGFKVSGMGMWGLEGLSGEILWDFSVFGDLALMHNGGFSKGRDGKNKESTIRKLLLLLCYTRRVYVEEIG